MNEDANLETTIDKRIQCIVVLLEKYVGEVTVHKVAAMPEPNKLEVGYGLEELLYTPAYYLQVLLKVSRIWITAFVMC